MISCRMVSFVILRFTIQGYFCMPDKKRKTFSFKINFLPTTRALFRDPFFISVRVKSTVLTRVKICMFALSPQPTNSTISIKYLKGDTDHRALTELYFCKHDQVDRPHILAMYVTPLVWILSHEPSEENSLSGVGWYYHKESTYIYRALTAGNQLFSLALCFIKPLK